MGPHVCRAVVYDTPWFWLATWHCCSLLHRIGYSLCRPVVRPRDKAGCGKVAPFNLLNPLSGMVHTVNGYRGGMYGFPSCHAANSFALAAIVALMLRSRMAGWFIFIWAALNSYSRLYLGVHYPGDLLCGCVLGVLCGAACYGVFSLVSREKSFENKRVGSAVSLADLLPLSGLAITVGIAVVALFAY